MLGYGTILAWWLAGDQIVSLLYGPAFAGAAPVLLVHGLATLPLLHGELRGAILVIEQKTIWGVRCAFAGLALNVLLNLWLMPAYGALGAAWATVITYTLVWFIASLVLPTLRQIGRQQVSSLSLVPFFKCWRSLLS